MPSPRRKHLRQAVPFALLEQRRERRRRMAAAGGGLALVVAAALGFAMLDSRTFARLIAQPTIDAGTAYLPGMSAAMPTPDARGSVAVSENGRSTPAGSTIAPAGSTIAPAGSTIAPSDPSTAPTHPVTPPTGQGAGSEPVPTSAPPPPAARGNGLDPLGYAYLLTLSPTTAPPEQLTGYQWPIRKGLITSFFAPRSNGFLVVDGQRIHQGLDVATYCGDRIRAAHDGTVLAAGRNFEDAMGYDGSIAAFESRLQRRHETWALPIVVVIDDGNGYRSAYVHLEDTTVKVGQQVRAGQTIGHEGMTGNASGCHLHYELFRMDGPWMSIAPEYVKKEGYPPQMRERIDPLRVLSLHDRWAPRMVPGINPPRESPGLGRPTASRPGH